MSDPEAPDKPNKPDCDRSDQAPDRTQRLASIKPPRDLSLGGVKPNKKIFTPNLNVTRNKNRGPVPNLTDNKREDRRRRDQRNRHVRNEPNIIKSSGVFSEGLGSAERQSSRSAYHNRDSDPAPALQKPTIRVKDVIKIDKEFEERQIKNIASGAGTEEIEVEDFQRAMDFDAPVKLPMDDGGCTHTQKKQTVHIKQEVVVKEEPTEDADPRSGPSEMTIPDVKDLHDDTNIGNLLRSVLPTLMLLQFPDTLPGQGGGADDDAPRPGSSQASADAEARPKDNRCTLHDLEEGRIGTIKVRRSGKVIFVLNGGQEFEISSGTKAAFHQEVVSMKVEQQSKSAELISLGNLQQKLIVTPKWESLFANMEKDK